MGKGDKKSKRGKIWRGTNGKRRPSSQKLRKRKKLDEEERLEYQTKIDTLIIDAKKAEKEGNFSNAAELYASAAELSAALRNKKDVIRYSKLAEKSLKESKK